MAIFSVSGAQLVRCSRCIEMSSDSQVNAPLYGNPRSIYVRLSCPCLADPFDLKFLTNESCNEEWE